MIQFTPRRDRTRQEVPIEGLLLAGMANPPSLDVPGTKANQPAQTDAAEIPLGHLTLDCPRRQLRAVGNLVEAEKPFGWLKR
ncbi:MAG: hypothetical protein ABI224_14045, partial [Acetobacteraceae bacterium]